MPTTLTSAKLPSPSLLQSLPRDLREMTTEQRDAWVQWEAEAYTLGQLRRRQGIVESQLRMAQSDAPAAGIASLQIHSDILAAAVSLQTFGDR